MTMMLTMMLTMMMTMMLTMMLEFASRPYRILQINYVDIDNDKVEKRKKGCNDNDVDGYAAADDNKDNVNYHTFTGYNVNEGMATFNGAGD